MSEPINIFEASKNFLIGRSVKYYIRGNKKLIQPVMIIDKESFFEVRYRFVEEDKGEVFQLNVGKKAMQALLVNGSVSYYSNKGVIEIAV